MERLTKVRSTESRRRTLCSEYPENCAELRTILTSLHERLREPLPLSSPYGGSRRWKVMSPVGNAVIDTTSDTTQGATRRNSRQPPEKKTA
jgi:hypothetical protein